MVLRVLALLAWIVLGSACGRSARIEVVLPDSGGDLAIVVLVEADGEGRYPVLANTGLIRVAEGAPSMAAEAAVGSRLRVAVFLYDSAELAGAIAPASDPASLPEIVAVDPATAGQSLLRDGRSDWVSEDLRADHDGAVFLAAVATDPERLAVRDRVEAQLMLSVAVGDGGCVPGGFAPPTALSEVNSDADDRSPAVSADGLTLYFSSDRPGGAGGRDIWIAKRPDTSSSFGAATAVAELGSAAHDDFPSISADDLTLHFASGRPGGQGGWDIWVAERDHPESAFGAPTNLSEVNSSGLDAGPSVSLDGLTLYFASDRPGSMGTGGYPDIWFCERSSTSSAFGPAVDLAEINSEEEDIAPWISADGLTLYFASIRDTSAWLDVWISTRPSLSSPFQTPVSLSAVNSGSNEMRPCVSADAMVLYVDSDRAGFLSFDIWAASRICL